MGLLPERRRQVLPHSRRRSDSDCQNSSLALHHLGMCESTTAGWFSSGDRRNQWKNLSHHRGRRPCLSTLSASARTAYVRTAYRPTTTDMATSPVATVTSAAKAHSRVSQLFRIHSLGASALSMQNVAARVFTMLDESTRTIIDISNASSLFFSVAFSVHDSLS